MIKRIYEIVGKGQGVIEELTPENLLLLKSNDENGSLQNLQQVLNQGSDASIQYSDGSYFEANLPMSEDLGQSVRLALGDGTGIFGQLLVEVGSAILNSNGYDGPRVFDFQRQAPQINTDPGAYSAIENLYTRNLLNNQESRLSIQIPSPAEGTNVQYRFPYSLVNAILTLATEEFVDKAIVQLINGAPSDANTLKELNDKIVALQAIVGGSDPDGNSIVDTIAELLAVFQTYPEGTDIATILAGKVNSSDIVNNLTQLIPGKILDARQGPVIAALIAAKWTAVDATNLVRGILKLYNGSGNNTDGAIEQKFFTETTLAKKGIENANYQILATDKWVYTLGNFSANRTFTLPGDAPQGKEIIIADEQGAVGTYTLIISAPAGKKLNGVTNGTETILSAYGWRRFVTDGNGNWFFDAGIVRQSQFSNALTGKVNLDNWVDYSLLSTVNGFSTLSTVVIKYIPIGKSFLYYFFISGASNGTNFTFTIHTNHLGATYITSGGLNRNGGNLSNNPPRITITSTSSTISILNTLAGSTWGSAGTKEASGWFIVESN